MEETPSDLLEQVLDTLSVARPDIVAADLGICHRGAPRRGKHKGKPRTVTVVFLRASLKDSIMSRENRGKIRNRITDQQTGDKSGGIFHRMSRGLVERKQSLEKVPGVLWAYFSGHHLFTVKMKKEDGTEEIRHNIINEEQLL